LSEATRTIFHVDVDAFYASVESHNDPSLVGKAVVVGADPKNGKGRGVVVACSYEARAHGIRSGMPISRAFKLYPNAAFIRPNLALYSEVSKRVMESVRKYADELEQAGIDEAFLDVSSKVRDDEGAKRLAREIKDQVRRDEGLTCSIGVAPNKSAAKIASDLQKPDGLTLVPWNAVAKFLAPLPVSVIPGVGKKTTAFLESRNIKLISQLQEVPGKQLVKWFGKNGVWLWGVANGKEMVEVRERTVPKSLNVERTLQEDLEDLGSVRKIVDELTAELIARLRRANLQYRTVGVKVRFTGFETHTTEKSFVDYSDDSELALTTTRALLETLIVNGRTVRLLGVRASGLRHDDSRASQLESWA
jgi:DNA polymerase IV (DinB-like DNA polymerase)